MRTKALKETLFLKILVRTLKRFNPFAKPIIPANLTITLCALIYSFLFVIQWIRYNFNEDYEILAISGWCFVLLMNLFEAIGEIIHERKGS